MNTLEYAKFVAILFASALLLPWSGRAATVTVDIVDFTFRPPTVTVKVGDTVTWVQKDTIQHNSASDTGIWRGPLLSVNQTFSRVFDTPGSFPYHCDPHPGMRGTVIVEAAAANQPPTVSITSPANGAIVTEASVTFEATASDPDGSVAQVEFFAGRRSLGAATASPFRVTATFDPGTHSVTAQATDNQGATASSSVVTFTVTAANAAPTVAITTPANGATFAAPATVHLEAQASDPDGTISRVEFFSGNTSAGEATTAPFVLTLNDLAAGDYVFTATATDNQGASTTSAPVMVSVSAPAAVPALSAPRRLADGSFSFTVQGTAGRTYLVQASADGQSWETIQTIPASADSFDVTDGQAAGVPWRFYRLAQQ